MRLYNTRRKEVIETTPNAAHRAIRRLEEAYDVEVITQNIDDLHERAGSSRITHLHGEIRKLRSSINENLIVPLEGWWQDPQAKAPDGSLERPFVVFFRGECADVRSRPPPKLRRRPISCLLWELRWPFSPAASLVR